MTPPTVTPPPTAHEKLRDSIAAAIAYLVCQRGGHIPNRDRSLPGSCSFHLDEATAIADLVLPVVDAAHRQARRGLQAVSSVVNEIRPLMALRGADAYDAPRKIEPLLERLLELVDPEA